MLFEEMSLDGQDLRAFQLDASASQRAQQYKVLVIGAGLSGLLMALRLQEAGIPYVLYEKNSGVGGTWFENQYPGCRVDTPSCVFSFSFAHNPDWGHPFSPQRDVLDYSLFQSLNEPEIRG